MENLSIWQDEEVKTLFKFIEIKKSEGLPLIKIFDEFAMHTGRCQNSVRNYYYKEIKELTKNKDRCKALGIKLCNHIAKTPNPFSEKESQSVIDKINELVLNGYSVRRACLTLANGDATKMIRFQNKYRSHLKQNKENKKMDNIITMPEKRNIMSDEDIKALFMGLLKLVKKQEGLKMKDLFSEELNEANLKLRNAMTEIILKSEKIKKLQSEITILKKEIELNKQKEIENRVLVAGGRAKQLIKQFVAKKQGRTEEVCNN